MRILISGGCGFLGHHFVEHIIKKTSMEIVILDSLTYASTGFERLRDINVYNDKRIKIFCKDIRNSFNLDMVREVGEVDYIVHLAAETHVDRSIETPIEAIKTNVIGTHNMLELAKLQKNLKWFNMFSTDEVYGPADPGYDFKEDDPYNSTNPYSATKAGAEQLANAYANTYGIPVFITNTMNIFGERQHPEKFIPLVINKVINGEMVYIHSDETKIVSGSRYWIHARNVSDALLFLLDRAEKRGRYNIVGQEYSNLDIAKMIAKIIGKPLKYKMIDFHSSRPGHDLRYALDGTKMKKMGWEAPVSVEESLKKTIEWTLKNDRWLK